jgi:phage replication-related protein YjqB (UPF0714/DUF867 family)
MAAVMSQEEREASTSVVDQYQSFAALAEDAPDGSWRVVHRHVPQSDVLIVAPHGGGIEPGTSGLATMIAAEEYNLYCFEGLKKSDNRDLHVTSHRFDDPRALSLAARSAIVVGIHGCKGANAIFVGGLDTRLVAFLTDALLAAGFPARSQGHDFPAVHPQNICNRGSRGAGAQLELTVEFRSAARRASISRVVRQSIARQQQELTTVGEYSPNAEY